MDQRITVYSKFVRHCLQKSEAYWNSIFNKVKTACDQP